MCQLTFCKINIPAQTEMFSILSLICNTFISHHDGWGIFGGGKIFKTHMNAQLTTDIGKIIEEYHVRTSPIISHVRLASFGTTISSDNSHPFETDNFVLAHNGTLVVKKKSEVTIDEIKKKNVTKADVIDSEIFTFALESEYAKVKDVPTALKNAMDMFCGKFAFMIYCKPENQYYIVRGKTAELCFTVFSREETIIGIAVNTEKDSLNRTIHLFSNLLLGSGIEVEYTPIEELNKETIYLYKASKLIKVGEIKESEKETIPFSSNWDYSTVKKTTYKHSSIDIGVINKTINFMEEFYLSVDDIDRLLFFTVEKGILTIEESDMDDFLTKVIPRLTTSKHFRKDVGKLIEKYKFPFIPFDFYKENNHQYPYMLITSRSEQISFINELEKFLKEKYA
jgi:predicted glutamine amidotransferase